MDRLSQSDAQHLIRRAAKGEIRLIVTPHFKKALADDGITMPQAVEVMRTGVVRDHPEFHACGDWRYKVEGFEPDGKYMALIFTFRASDCAVAITTFEQRYLSRR